MLIAEKRTLVGALPPTTDYSDPVKVGDANRVTIQVVLLQVTMGSGVTATLEGSNIAEGTYAAVSGTSTTVSSVGDVGVARYSSIPFAFVRVKFTASSGVHLYTANLNLTKS